MTEQMRANYAAALEETALAYFRRRDRIQYESALLTYMPGGPQRRTDYISPESATKDSYMFSVCSAFMHSIFWDTCRFDLCDSASLATCRHFLRDYAEHIRYEYHAGGEQKFKKSIRECLETLKPGDFFIVTNAEAEIYHVMLWLSGRRLIHCAGKKMKLAEGVEQWEPYGAIRLEDIDVFLLNPIEGSYPFTKMHDWWSLRILDAIDPTRYPLTPSAQTRLDYPGLTYDRTASVRRYQTVTTGDTITYTIRVRNTNDAKSKAVYEDLVVEEKIPAGTSLVMNAIGADAVISRDTIRWTLRVEPLQECVLQYTVKVEAEPGAYIVSEGCRAGDIPGCCIKTLVAKPRLSLEDCAKLRGITADCAMGDAAWVYETVLKKTVKIPELQTYLDGMYDRVDAAPMPEAGENQQGKFLLRRKKAPSAEALETEKMMMPGMLGGRSLYEPQWYERILEFRTENLCPGDVVLVARNLTADTVETEQLVMLGGGKMLKTTAAGTVLEDVPYMDCIFSADYFAVARPYLVGFAG